MKKLQNLNINDMLFIDIETVRAENIITKDSKLWDAWQYKTRYMNDMSNKMDTSSITSEDLFTDKAALYAPFSKVSCITIGKIVKDDVIKLHSYYSYDEFELLSKFNNNLNGIFEKNPSTYFVGFYIKPFDIPFIIKRMLCNRIKPSYLLDKGDIKPWDMKDIDLSEIWKGTSIYSDSLLSVATALGLESPKVDINGSETSHYYYNVNNGVTQIARYCEKDVITCVNIYLSFIQKEIITKFISNIK